MGERREQILAAARELVDERGASSLSVRHVAARAGIGASTLRHYFPSQRALFDAVLGAQLDAQLDDLRIREAGVPAVDRLTECLWQFLPRGDDAVALERWFATVAAVLGPDARPEVRQTWASFLRSARRRVIGWLEVVEAEGGLADGGAERHARLLLAAVDGVGLWRMMPEAALSVAEAEQVIRDAVAAVLVGPDPADPAG